MFMLEVADIQYQVNHLGNPVAVKLLRCRTTDVYEIHFCYHNTKCIFRIRSFKTKQQLVKTMHGQTGNREKTVLLSLIILSPCSTT